MRSVVPTPLVCEECKRADLNGIGRGWRAYVVGADDDGFGEPCDAVAAVEHAGRQAREARKPVVAKSDKLAVEHEPLR